MKNVILAMVLLGASIFEWLNVLRESCERDLLTRLQNRAAFEQTIRTLVPRAHADGQPITLVVADIDHSKPVNGFWEHRAGDQAISSFGQLMKQMVRGCDVGGRTGGKQVRIVVWNYGNGPARRLAARIREAFPRLSMLT